MRESIFCGHNAAIYYPLSVATFKTRRGRRGALRPSALSGGVLGQMFPFAKVTGGERIILHARRPIYQIPPGCTQVFAIRRK